MNKTIKNYQEPQKVFDTGLQAYMVRVYSNVTLSLLVTATSAAITLSLKPLMLLLFKFDELGYMMGYTGAGYLVAFSPFFIAMYLGGRFLNMSLAQLRFLLGLYAAITGMSFASLAFVYTGASLSKTFFITAVMFGGMSLYGYTTKRNLTSMGSFCIMALWGIIISSLVNFFLQSELMYFIISLAGVFVFIGLIAFRTQQLKNIYYSVSGTDVAVVEKTALMGAFMLYLSFLNLFLFLLRFFGERRRRN